MLCAARGSFLRKIRFKDIGELWAVKAGAKREVVISIFVRNLPGDDPTLKGVILLSTLNRINAVPIRFRHKVKRADHKTTAARTTYRIFLRLRSQPTNANAPNAMIAPLE